MMAKRQQPLDATQGAVMQDTSEVWWQVLIAQGLRWLELRGMCHRWYTCH